MPARILISLGHQILLIPERGARADNGHIANEDIPKLRQLVEACFSQHAANAGNAMVGILQLMRRNITRGFHMHGSKLKDLEKRLILAHALLPKEHRAF